MKQLKSYKTTTFADGDFRIDIVETRTEFGAWIYRHNVGTKSFIYGCQKKTTTFDEFVETIEATIDEDKEHYDEEIELLEEAWDNYFDSLPQPELDTRKRRAVIVRTATEDIEYIIVEDKLAYAWKVPYRLCDKAVEGHLNAHVNPRYHEFEINHDQWKQTTIEDILKVCEWNEILGEKVTA